VLDVSDVSQIVASLRHLPRTPVTRIYFDVTQPVGFYKTAIGELHPVSYLMGELLDSSDERRISTAEFGERVRSFLAAYGDQIDIWEIGNEVNGDWTGPYQEVAAKQCSDRDLRRIAASLGPARSWAVSSS